MKSELSRRIKSLRKKKGYTQGKFAELLGVGQTTVANYERGIRIPDMEKLTRIASIFDVTMDYLLGIDEKYYSKNAFDAKNRTSVSLDEASSVFLSLLLNGYGQEAGNLITGLHDKRANIRELYFDVLGRVLREVGVLWERGSIDVWKEHYISETVMDIMSELKARERRPMSKPYSVLALTSGPELHNIGIKMIAYLLELEGFDVTYLGSNVPVLSIIKAIEIKKPDIIAISVTMPYHIEAAKNTIAALKGHFGSNSPRIILGGGAFRECRDAWRETGADYYGAGLDDVISAIEKGGV